MKQFEQNIKVTYRWWRSDGKDIKPVHIEALKDVAIGRIQQMMQSGHTYGQLLDSIRMTSRDPEDGLEYSGYWEMKEV